MSLSFPTSPTVGQVYNNQWVWNGSAWAPYSGTGITARKFLLYGTPGTYTLNSSSLPVGTRFIKATCVGGGGGGGGGYNASPFYLGTGGSGGGLACKIFDVSTITFPVTITVGAAGLGGHFGTSNTNGGNGGTTSFGSLLSATGGGGGSYGTTNNASTGPPGVGSGGDFNIAGSWPTVSTSSSYSQGASPSSGGSAFGFGGSAIINSQTGGTTALAGYGGGGPASQTATDANANGQPGLCLIEVLA